MPNGGPARPLRVVHVVSRLELAGLERVIAELLEGQAEVGIDSRALVVHSAGVLGDRLVEAHYPVTVLNAPTVRPWKVVPELTMALHDLAPDVVHLHGGHWWSFARSIRRGSAAPFVYTLHGEHHPVGWRERVVEFAGSRYSDYIVLVSNELYNYAGRGRLLLGRPNAVVRNGIRQLDLPSPERHAPHDSFQILHVARLEEVKRQDLTLHAVAGLAAVGINARVAFAGRGKHKEAFAALAVKLGVEDRVEWLGVVPDTEVASHMSRSHCLVLPSDTEGTSIALLEAIAAELPCVVSDVGDSALVLRAAREWVFPMGDLAAFVSVLRSVAADQTEAQATARRVKADVRERYGRRSMVESYSTIYGELLARRA